MSTGVQNKNGLNIIIFEKYVKYGNAYMNPRLNNGKGLHHFFKCLEEILYNLFGRCKIIFVFRSKDVRPHSDYHDTEIYTNLSDAIDEIEEVAAIIIPGIDEPIPFDDIQILRTFIERGGRIWLMYDDKSNIDRSYGNAEDLTEKINRDILGKLGVSFRSDTLETGTWGQHPEVKWLERPLLSISDKFKDLIKEINSSINLDQIFYWGCSIAVSKVQLEKAGYELIPIILGKDGRYGMIALTRTEGGGPNLVICGGRFTFDLDSFCEEIRDPQSDQPIIKDYDQKLEEFVKNLFKWFFKDTKNMDLSQYKRELIKSRISQWIKENVLLLVGTICIIITLLSLELWSKKPWIEKNLLNFLKNYLYIILGVFLTKLSEKVSFKTSLRNVLRRRKR